MQKYEVPLVIKPLLPEDVTGRVLPDLQKMVKSLGGSATVKQDWGKRHLAYPIKGMTEAYYLFIALELEGAKLNDFHKGMRKVVDVMRYLVIREDNL